LKDVAYLNVLARDMARFGGRKIPDWTNHESTPTGFRWHSNGFIHHGPSRIARLFHDVSHNVGVLIPASHELSEGVLPTR
jgi:hypothetical protein